MRTALRGHGKAACPRKAVGMAPFIGAYPGEVIAMLISRTPFRISFFGGGTDYPAWYRHHGGAVLAASIDKYCYLTCRHLPPFFDHRIRLVYRQIETCKTIDDIEHPVVRSVLRHLDFRRGLELHHDGDLPARSGMGSSSTVAVG